MSYWRAWVAMGLCRVLCGMLGCELAELGDSGIMACKHCRASEKRLS